MAKVQGKKTRTPEEKERSCASSRASSWLQRHQKKITEAGLSKEIVKHMRVEILEKAAAMTTLFDILGKEDAKEQFQDRYKLKNLKFTADDGEVLTVVGKNEKGEERVVHGLEGQADDEEEGVDGLQGEEDDEEDDEEEDEEEGVNGSEGEEDDEEEGVNGLEDDKEDDEEEGVNGLEDDKEDDEEEGANGLEDDPLAEQQPMEVVAEGENKKEDDPLALEEVNENDDPLADLDEDEDEDEEQGNFPAPMEDDDPLALEEVNENDDPLADLDEEEKKKELKEAVLQEQAKEDMNWLRSHVHSVVERNMAPADFLSGPFRDKLLEMAQEIADTDFEDALQCRRLGNSFMELDGENSHALKMMVEHWKGKFGDVNDDEDKDEDED